MDASFDPDLELGVLHILSSSSQDSQTADLPPGGQALGDFTDFSADGNGLGSLANELEQLDESQPQFESLGYVGLDEEVGDSSATFLPPTPHMRQRSAKASASSVLSADAVDETLELEAEQAFTSASTALEASLQPAKDFVSRLQASCSDVVDASAGEPSRLHSTAKLEALCTSLLQTLAVIVKQREKHARDVRSLDKTLSSLSPAQVASLEPLSADMTEQENLRPSGLSTLEEEPSSPASAATNRSSSKAEQSLFPTGLSTGLKGLQSSTSSLLSTLSSINEATQVQKAAHADASRRLKSLRTTLTSWRAELEELDHAQSGIERFERAKSGSSATRARTALADIGNRLGIAEREARELLRHRDAL